MSTLASNNGFTLDIYGWLISGTYWRMDITEEVISYPRKIGESGSEPMIEKDYRVLRSWTVTCESEISNQETLLLVATKTTGVFESKQEPGVYIIGDAIIQGANRFLEGDKKITLHLHGNGAITIYRMQDLEAEVRAEEHRCANQLSKGT